MKFTRSYPDAWYFKNSNWKNILHSMKQSEKNCCSKTLLGVRYLSKNNADKCFRWSATVKEIRLVSSKYCFVEVNRTNFTWSVHLETITIVIYWTNYEKIVFVPKVVFASSLNMVFKAGIYIIYYLFACTYIHHWYV